MPAWAKDAAERQARVQAYSADVDAGRRIRFIPSGRRLA